MARPVSAETVALMAALVDGPGTTAQLAGRAGVSCKRAAMLALDNMVRRGEVDKLDPVRVAGVKRPVPVYARAELDDQADESQGVRGGVHDLIAVWAGLVPGRGVVHQRVEDRQT